METTTTKKSSKSVKEMNIGSLSGKELEDRVELIEREEIKDSPFTVITTDNKSFGVMGNYRLTEAGSKKEIKEELSKITWNRVVQVFMLLAKINEEKK